MPLQIVDADAMTQTRSIVDTTHAVEFPDKKVAFSIETNAVRAMDVVPHGNELAVRVKHLDAMAFPIRYVDIVILVDDHVVRPDELARINARRAPGEQVLPFGGEFVDFAVAIPVRDVEMPSNRRHGHMGRAIERIALPLRSGAIGTAQGHQELAIQREFLHCVDAIIHAVHHIVRTNMDTMRPGAEHALTPGAQEVAIAVKDDHRVLATIEDVDIVLGVHCRASHIDELPAGWELFPIFHGLKEQHATTDDGGHSMSPLLKSLEKRLTTTAS